uniref:Bacteriophage related protein n=1 Tax=Ralstonia solanacearum TaxID=305 RepID=A0A0S4X6D2_RALSL
MLTRDFMGQTHRVVALPNGQFEYNGKPYSSLTAISQAIAVRLL